MAVVMFMQKGRCVTIILIVMVQEGDGNKVKENKTLRFCYYVKSLCIMKSRSMLYAILDGKTPKLFKSLCSCGYQTLTELHKKLIIDITSCLFVLSSLERYNGLLDFK